MHHLQYKYYLPKANDDVGSPADYECSYDADGHFDGAGLGFAEIPETGSSDGAVWVTGKDRLTH